MTITRSRANGAVAPAVRGRVHGGLDAGTALVRVQRSAIHGRGLFAVQAVVRGTYLGRYEGEVTERDGRYVLWVENQARTGTYGVRGQNHLRFVNHSSRPNAEFDGEDLHALRSIRAGEEITVHYGPDWA